MRLARRQLCALRLVLVALLASTQAAAQGFGVGVASSAGLPALSVQSGSLKTGTTAWHMTAHYAPLQARASADWQRLFVPVGARGAAWRAGLYSGLGLEGESRRESAATERWRIRLPLGVQCELDDLHLSTFVEAAGLVGDLPATSVAGTFAGGLRATF